MSRKNDIFGSERAEYFYKFRNKFFNFIEKAIIGYNITLKHRRMGQAFSERAVLDDA